MGVQDLIDGYLEMDRDDVPTLIGAFGVPVRWGGGPRTTLEQRHAVRDELASRGPDVIKNMLDVLALKLPRITQIGKAWTDPEFTLGKVKCVIANAEEVVARIGDAATLALLAALLDPTPVIRSLGAAFLALLSPNSRDVALLEQHFEREKDAVTRIVMGGALLNFATLCSTDVKADAWREVSAWADSNQPDWRSWARSTDLDQENALGRVIVGGCLDRLVCSQLQ